MVTNNGLFRVVAALLIAIVASMVITTIAAGEATEQDFVDPSRDKIEEVLVDVEDNEAVFGVSIAAAVAWAFLAIAAAGGLYTLLRDSHGGLAVWGYTGMVAGGICLLAAQAGNFAMAALANDLAEGGAGGAGEPEVLEVARAIGIVDGFFYISAISLIGLGIMAYGAVLLTAQATEGAVIPPRWLGWLGVASGILHVCILAGFVAEPFFGLSFLGQVLSVIWFLGLAVWLIARSPATEAQPAAVAA